MAHCAVALARRPRASFPPMLPALPPMPHRALILASPRRVLRFAATDRSEEEAC
jgi:hypothetical protein